MKKIISIIILLTLISLIAYDNYYRDSEEIKITKTTIQREQTKGIDVFFCPKDNCSYELVRTLNAAKETLHCALYDIDLDDVKKTLSNLSKKIDVKVVVDDHYKKKLTGSGVRYDTSSQLTHNKFCIIDDSIVWTGSFNPTKRGAYKNNNNALRIYSRNLASNYEAEFSELWDYTFGKGEKVKNPELIINDIKIENYFCPEDDCGYHVKENLKTAKSSIYFMTFSFTHNSIANTILLKNNQSVEIRGVMEKTQISQYSRYELFRYQGINVRKDGNKYNMHNKVFIIDNRTVITGSFNPSSGGDNRNDENIIIIHNKDIAQMYIDEFEYIWANATVKNN